MVGGEPVDHGLGVRIVRVGNCSGTLIAPSSVLTAAHCVEASGEARVQSGSSTTNAKCVVHPGYRSSEATHDLAICRLGGSSSAEPILLVEDAFVLDVGATVQLVGYGLSSPFEHGAGELRLVDTRVVQVLKEGLLAGTVKETACRGDSGGPMIVFDGAIAHVAGVIHGPSGAFCASPAVVVRVAEHRAWIDSVIAPEPSASCAPLGVAGVAVGIVIARVALAIRKRRAATGKRGMRTRRPRS